MIKLPMLTPGMEHALLAKWRVKPGDVIRAGDIVAEIETEKATLEVESAVAGVIDELCVAEGTADVKVDTILARLQGDPPARARRRVLASPLARRIARAAKVDLSRIAGSGPRGRVTKRDVEAALATAPEELASFTELGIVPGAYDLVPLDGMRKAIARRLSEAFRDIPHFSLTIDLRVDELLSLRSQLNALIAKDGTKVSINDMIVRAAATALMRVPAANASYTADGIAMHHNADIAVAVAVEGGLVTPIVRAAQTKSLSSIAAEIKELSSLARSKRLQPQQFHGGTFSVSNLGMLGIRSFTSILNPPHGCIMSVGAAEQRVIVRDGAPAVAWMMTVTLTCDHRVVDGAIGARLLTAFREVIESPVALLV